MSQRPHYPVASHQGRARSRISTTVGALAPTGTTVLTPGSVVVAMSVLTPVLVFGGITLTPAPAAASFTATTPTVTVGTLALTPTPVVASFTITTPTITGAGTVTPSAVVVVFTATAPTIQQTTPAVGDVLTAGTTANVKRAIREPERIRRRTVSHITGALEATTEVVVLTPAPVATIFTTTTPTVVRGALTLTPTPVVAAFTTTVPTVVMPGTVLPSPVAATFTATTPTVVATSPGVPPLLTAGTTALVKRAPRVHSTAQPLAAPTAFVEFQLTASVLTPTSVTATFTTVTPTVVTTAPPVPPLTMAGTTNRVRRTALVHSRPRTLPGSKAFGAITPAAGTLTPTPVVAAFTTTVPTVVRGTRTLTPLSSVVAFSATTPQLLVGGAILPQPVVVSFASTAPNVTAGAVVLTPTPVVAAFVTTVPSISRVNVLAPLPSASSFVATTPTVVLGIKTVTPGAVVVSFAATNPSTGGSIVVTPTPVAVVCSTTTPVVVLGVRTLSTSSVVVAFSATTPTLTGIGIAPASVAVAFTVPQPQQVYTAKKFKAKKVFAAGGAQKRVAGQQTKRRQVITGEGIAPAAQSIVNVTVEQMRVFDSPQVNSVHGSVFVDPYYIGTPRGAIAVGLEDVNRIVRVHKDDLSNYQTIRLDDPRPGVTASFRSMEGACYSPTRGKIYTIGYSGEFGVSSIVAYVIEITPEPFSAVLLAEVPISSIGFADAVVTDNDFLYYTENDTIWKFSLDTLAIVDSVSVFAVVPRPHSMQLSQYDGLLYVTSSFFAGDNAKMARYDPNNLAAGALASVQIPGSTDDGCESGEYIFGGIEIFTPGPFGYGWGAYAVRRSDFAFFSLPALAADDDPGVLTFNTAVLDGRWLILLKNNRKLYAIDLQEHPPDTWSQQANVSNIVDIVATFQSADIAGWTDGAGILLIPAEFTRDGSGRFLSFGWPSAGSVPFKRSGVIRYTVPGL